MHTTVLKNEAIKHLNIKEGGKYIDGTYGFGGHTREIRLNGGRVLSIEKDGELLKPGVIHDTFANILEIARENDFYPVDGILFDFGVSAWHFEGSNRGFSFRGNEPLDMRLDKRQKLTAQMIVNEWEEDEISEIIKTYGEEKHHKEIAKKIVGNRPIKTTKELVKIIEDIVPRSKIHPATKTFQAIRIVVNNELEEIEKALYKSVETLKSGGKIVVITFHSGEDRIVKHFFKNNKDKLKTLTKKPIIPSDEEIRNNPRSRSAKLRVAKKL